MMNPKVDSLVTTLLSESNSVVITKFDYDEGDKRSWGGFEIEAKVPAGTLKGSGQFDSGGNVEDEWTINGEALDGSPDIQFVHYYSGSRAVDKFAKSKEKDAIEAISRWLKNAVLKTSKAPEAPTANAPEVKASETDNLILKKLGGSIKSNGIEGKLGGLDFYFEASERLGRFNKTERDFNLMVRNTTVEDAQLPEFLQLVKDFSDKLNQLTTSL